MPINETQLNGRIATLLDRMNARWSAYGETHGAFEGNQRQPDILVHQQGLRPVIIENEYLPAHTVEPEAIARLGERPRHRRCRHLTGQDQRRSSTQFPARPTKLQQPLPPVCRLALSTSFAVQHEGRDLLSIGTVSRSLITIPCGRRGGSRQTTNNPIRNQPLFHRSSCLQRNGRNNQNQPHQQPSTRLTYTISPIRIQNMPRPGFKRWLVHINVVNRLQSGPASLPFAVNNAHQVDCKWAFPHPQVADRLSARTVDQY